MFDRTGNLWISFCACQSFLLCSRIRRFGAFFLFWKVKYYYAFKLECVELVLKQHYSIKSVSSQKGLHESNIRKWVLLYRTSFRKRIVTLSTWYSKKVTSLNSKRRESQTAQVIMELRHKYDLNILLNHTKVNTVELLLIY